MYVSYDFKSTFNTWKHLFQRPDRVTTKCLARWQASLFISVSLIAFLKWIQMPTIFIHVIYDSKISTLFFAPIPSKSPVASLFVMAVPSSEHVALVVVTHPSWRRQQQKKSHNVYTNGRIEITDMRCGKVTLWTVSVPRRGRRWRGMNFSGQFLAHVSGAGSAAVGIVPRALKTAFRKQMNLIVLERHPWATWGSWVYLDICSSVRTAPPR